MLERERVRDREEVADGRHDALGVAAVAIDAHHAVVGARGLVTLEAVGAATAREVVVHVHPLADGDGRHAVAERPHRPGDVVARDQREAGGVRVPDVLAHPDVEAVDGNRRDIDGHLAEPGSGLGSLDDLQQLGASVALQHDRAHQ